MTTETDEKPTTTRRIATAIVIVGIAVFAMLTASIADHGWGAFDATHAPGLNSDDPVIAAVGGAHETINDGIWGDGDRDTAVREACFELTRARDAAVNTARDAATVDAIEEVRAICSDVETGDATPITLHTNVEILEDRMLEAHRDGEPVKEVPVEQVTTTAAAVTTVSAAPAEPRYERAAYDERDVRETLTALTEDRTGNAPGYMIESTFRDHLAGDRLDRACSWAADVAGDTRGFDAERAVHGGIKGIGGDGLASVLTWECGLTDADQRAVAGRAADNGAVAWWISR